MPCKLEVRRQNACFDEYWYDSFCQILPNFVILSSWINQKYSLREGRMTENIL